MLRPLITAAQGFPALEQLAEGAEETLHMSFRIFDPATRLHGEGPRSRGLETWADLLSETTARGVKLRLLLADFDPFFTPDLHRLAWRSANHVREAVEGDVQVLCAPHGQVAGWIWRLLMRGTLSKRIAELKQEDETGLTPVEKAALKGVAHLRPVTLHQKFAVADACRGMIGGLDINDRRYDTPGHDLPPEETWHDVSMAVDGDFCGPLLRHFVDCWNRSLECGAAPEGSSATRMEEPGNAPDTPQSPVLLRTMSTPCPGVSRLSPRTEVREIEDGTLEAIRSARDSLYIETQFLRHKPVADALVEAARHPELDLVIILPAFADRVLFDGDRGWDARHAHALQTRALERIDAAYGERCAVIAPAQPRPANEKTLAIHGAGPVYVHSKVMLVDDHTGIVGSANLNGRSLRWDTEASIRFHDTDTIAAMRQELAQIWLGGTEDDITRAATWRAAAAANADLPPTERKGFAVPYPLERVRRFSRFLPILPDDMF
ncbi:phospholipase D family protein [Marinovum sp.]|uniref:phospholipase D family protein n=1 Tax=Marinovum sp. TaxID=2024839 RepID=UPI003A95856E